MTENARHSHGDDAREMESTRSSLILSSAVSRCAPTKVFIPPQWHVRHSIDTFEKKPGAPVDIALLYAVVRVISSSLAQAEGVMIHHGDEAGAKFECTFADALRDLSVPRASEGLLWLAERLAYVAGSAEAVSGAKKKEIADNAPTGGDDAGIFASLLHSFKVFFSVSLSFPDLNVGRTEIYEIRLETR